MIKILLCIFVSMLSTICLSAEEKFEIKQHLPVDEQLAKTVNFNTEVNLNVLLQDAYVKKEVGFNKEFDTNVVIIVRSHCRITWAEKYRAILKLELTDGFYKTKSGISVGMNTSDVLLLLKLNKPLSNIRLSDYKFTYNNYYYKKVNIGDVYLQFLVKSINGKIDGIEYSLLRVAP